MARYRVLAGQHIQADMSQPIDDATGRRPSKKFTTGQVVESGTDLVTRFGAGKFQLVGGKPGDEEVFPSQMTFPNGQVAEGFQVSTGEQARRESPPEVRADTAEEARRLAEHKPKGEQAADDEAGRTGFKAEDKGHAHKGHGKK